MIQEVVETMPGGLSIPLLIMVSVIFGAIMIVLRHYIIHKTHLESKVVAFVGWTFAAGLLFWGGHSILHAHTMDQRMYELDNAVEENIQQNIQVAGVQKMHHTIQDGRLSSTVHIVNPGGDTTQVHMVYDSTADLMLPIVEQVESIEVQPDSHLAKFFESVEQE